MNEVVVTKNASDDVFARAHAALGDRGIAELLLLTAQYSGLALFLNALRVDTDPAARLIVGE